MSAEKPTPAERIAAAQAKRAALQAVEAEAHAEQQATDLEALADLEATHGYERVFSVVLGGWTPGKGAATMVIARVPRVPVGQGAPRRHARPRSGHPG